MNNQKEIGSQGPIKKQQLFVNPITLINKQIPITLSEQKVTQTSPPSQYKDFTQFIIDTTHSNITPQSKTKIILKSQPPSKLKNYRTSICPYGIQCKKRLTCNYAHNQSQLRKPYRNRKNPCTRYQKGLCGLGSACPDYHGNMDLKKKNYKYKVLPCKQWQQKGKCSKGDLCIYLHGQQMNQIQQEEINEAIDEKNENANIHIIEIDNVKEVDKNQTVQKNNQSLKIDDKNDKSCNKPQLIGQIFKSSTTKKTIIAKQIIEQPIKKKQQANQAENNPVQEQNFNIEFNF